MTSGWNIALRSPKIDEGKQSIYLDIIADKYIVPDGFLLRPNHGLRRVTETDKEYHIDKTEPYCANFNYSIGNF